jgi:hypothetical protein
MNEPMRSFSELLSYQLLLNDYTGIVLTNVRSIFVQSFAYDVGLHGELCDIF